MTPMAKRLFMSFDIDQEGKLTFSQYMVVVYNFGVATSKDLLNLIFDLYFKTCFDMNSDVAQRDGLGPEQRTMRMEMLEILMKEGLGTKKQDQNSKDVLSYLKSQPYRK